jgi:hypothetical protein
MEPKPQSWIDWYRFARSRLDLSHVEAVSYANLRTVEQMNREHLRPEAA